MIINPEQTFFFRGKTFFAQALWNAVDKYGELKDKPFFQTFEYSQLFGNISWYVRNSRKVIQSSEFLGSENYPLVHLPNDLDEWQRVWNDRIKLPAATFKVALADNKYIEGFEKGMEWDAGAVDPLFAGDKI